MRGTAGCDRRQFLQGLGAGLVSASIASAAPVARPQAGPKTTAWKGEVLEQAEAAPVGLEALAAGANAVDAAVTAALAAAVVRMSSCGIAGYGGSMVVALANGKVTAINFNSTAPKAARHDMFRPDASGKVPGNVNYHGWLAAGVPGTLAGLQLALDHYGTWSFAKAVQPAIRLARDGFPVAATFPQFAKKVERRSGFDPSFVEFITKNFHPGPKGDIFRNPALAAMLTTLAQRNSVDSFYRGDIAQRIAAAFAKHGGLVTADDLAAHHAQEVAPVALSWRGATIYTAPLTAGGTTTLQILQTLKLLGWEKLDQNDPRTTHLRLEAQRVAWYDRLTLFGDPEQVQVPVEKLLSVAYAEQQAARVRAAVDARKRIPLNLPEQQATGTCHITASDRQGNLAAITLTHGGGYGAQVAVPELGFVFGHGMSRFDPRPGQANSPGPGKRPLHNMTPSAVFRDGKPVLALGGVGGRKISNAVLAVLLNYVGRDASVADSIAALRTHTEGAQAVVLDRSWPEAHSDYLKRLGYKVRRDGVAKVNAIGLDPRTGAFGKAGR